MYPIWLFDRTIYLIPSEKRYEDQYLSFVEVFYEIDELKEV